MEIFLIHLLKSSITLSLFYFVYFFLLRKDTFFNANRYFLLIGFLGSLVFPFIEFTIIEFIEQPFFDIAADTTNVSIRAESSLISNNWWGIAFYMYITITLVFIGRFLFQLISLYKVLRESEWTKDKSFYLLKTTQDISPFSFFRHIIFNPSHHTEEELTIILKHEKVHANQYHTLDILIANFFMIFQWVNPFVWLYKKELQQNLEFIADCEATRDLGNKQEYQLTLVGVSTNNYSSITNNFYHSLIKKRIFMLNKKKSSRHNLWKVTIIFPVLSLFLWGFNTNTEIQYITNTKNQSKNQLKKISSPSILTENTGLNSSPDIISNDNKVPLYMIDGKKATKKEADQLNPKDIASINVLKGENAIKKYGDKGKNGVLEIITKKEVSVNFKADDNYKTLLESLENDIKKPLLYINGKKASYNEYKKIDQKNISSLIVFKGQQALDKYGSEGKNGVILIELK